MKKAVLNNYSLPIIFLLLWCIYLKTLCPTLYVGDSGELIAGGYCLGIPHPPGYPLYELIGRLFSLLPLGEIAFRFNLLSALFTAAAVTMFACYLILLFGNLILSSSLAIVWALGTAHWEMASSTEVYPVAGFLFLVLLVVLHLAKTTHKDSYIYLAALIYGLGLSAHYSFLLFSVGVICYLFWIVRSMNKSPNWLIVLTFGLLGWLVFSYLPLRAVNQPPINWGNPLSYTNMINHIKRAEYSEVTAVRSFSQYFKQFYYLFLYIKAELPLFCGFFAFLGLIFFYIEKRAEFWLIVPIALVMVLGGSYFLNYDLLTRALGFGPKFFIPFYVMLIIWLAAVLNWLFKKSAVYTPYAILAVLILPLLSFSLHYSDSNLRKHRLARYLGEDLIMTPARNASLFVEEEDNELFILAYFINVLNKRADLKVFDPYGNLFAERYERYFDMKDRRPPDLRYRTQVENWSKNNKDFQPVFYTIKPYLNAPLQTVGLLYSSSPLVTNNIWQFYHNKDWVAVPLNYWSRYLVYTYSLHSGEALLKNGRLQKAMAIFSQAYQKVEGMQWHAFNLGVIFQENGYYNQAINAYNEEIGLGAVNRSAWVNLGVVFSKIKRYQKALYAFEKALAVKSDDADLLNEIGNLYYRLKNYQSAQVFYEKAIRLKPQTVDFQFNQALNMMELAPQQAELLWRQFLANFQNRINPTLLEQARQNLKRTKP